MTAAKEESPEFDFDTLTPGDAEDVAEEEIKKSRGLRAPSMGVRTRRGRKPTKKLEELQKRLSGEMFQAGAMIGMGLNTTGMYICQESDAFTKAVVDLAQTKPEWLDALENLANVQPGLIIGRTVFGVGAALAVDRKRIDPEKQMLKFLGVYTAWKRVQDNKVPETGKVEGSAYKPPPGGTFQPVGAPA